MERGIMRIKDELIKALERYPTTIGFYLSTDTFNLLKEEVKLQSIVELRSNGRITTSKDIASMGILIMNEHILIHSVTDKNIDRNTFQILTRNGLETASFKFGNENNEQLNEWKRILKEIN